MRGDERTEPPDESWRDVLIAIDVGTSGARAAAFDLDGRRRLEVRRSYPTTSPRPGWAEQDPRHWRAATIGVLARLAAQLGPRRKVHAIGLTGQCPSVVLVDAGHRPVTAGLIYRDNRATAEAEDLRRAWGDVPLHERTGHLPAAFHIAPKLRWIRHHDPDAWARAALVLQPRDWALLTLTGEVATDGSHAAATLLYDIGARAWDAELLGSLEVPASWMPRLQSSSAVAGGLRPTVAARVDLPSGIPVVLGGADSQACAFGAGVIEPGIVSEMAGTSTCLNTVVTAPLPELRVTHYPHVVGPSLTTETGINTTGAAVSWLAGLLYGGRSGRARAADFERLDREAAGIAAGADGVLVLPILGDGERSDPTLRGAVAGLSIRHGRAVLARAALEGVAFEIRDQIDVLRAAGHGPLELRISGGDAGLATWNRIKADVLGLPVRAIDGDAAATGVAMLAGIGVGVYDDVEAAIRRCVRPGPTIEPDARNRSTYADAFARYKSLRGSDVVRASVGHA